MRSIQSSTQHSVLDPALIFTPELPSANRDPCSSGRADRPGRPPAWGLTSCIKSEAALRRPPGGIIFHPDGCFLIRTQTCGLTSIVQTRFTEVIASCERGLMKQPAPNGDFHSLRRKMLLWVALLNGLLMGYLPLR